MGDLPQTSGVYLFRNKFGQIFYIGKAANLHRRVSSYWQKKHNDLRPQQLISEAVKIDIRPTPTVIEALILEAELIKKYQPKFNIREKDNKSFLYVVFTREKFPKPFLIRGLELSRLSRPPRQVWSSRIRPLRNVAAATFRNQTFFDQRAIFGPFVQAGAIRAALRILRKIFPYSVCNPHLNSPPARGRKGGGKSCFDYQIGLCPGVCIDAASRQDYMKNIRHLILFFRGKKQQILRNLKHEMKRAALAQDFEQAAKMRNQIFALEHIRDTALINKETPAIILPLQGGEKDRVNIFGRVEGYDISNISGTASVGSMVVFQNGEPAKDEYRKFKIKTVQGANDVGMLREVLRRRLTHFFIGHSERSEESHTLIKSKNEISRSLRSLEMTHEKCFWPLPDLIVIDGGIAQVNAAREVLKEYNLDIPVIGIAKGLSRKQDRPVFDKNNPDLEGIVQNHKNLLLQVRDEAHRFAITYHRKLRLVSMSLSRTTKRLTKYE